jgi:putative iron-dependent peroxidase
MPFGTVGKGEFGTYFIGYAATPSVTEQMLQNMFIGKPPGNYDRILDFSTAVTGNLFFVPSADMLDDPPNAPDATAATSDSDPGAAAVVPAAAAPPDDDPTGAHPVIDYSLKIGSLRRSPTS